MRKRGLCCGPMSIRPSVRLSVRLSVTFVHSIHMTEDIVKLLCRPGSPIILIFDPPAPIPNYKENPFSGGAKYKGVGKFCNFRLKSRKRYERLMVAMEGIQEVMCEWYHLIDHDWDFKVAIIFDIERLRKDNSNR